MILSAFWPFIAWMESTIHFSELYLNWNLPCKKFKNSSVKIGPPPRTTENYGQLDIRGRERRRARPRGGRRRQQGGRHLLDLSRSADAVRARPHMAHVLWEDHTRGVRGAVQEERVQQELPHVQSSATIIDGAEPRAGSSLGEKGKSVGHGNCCQ